jgi:CRISPR-associated protein Cst2
LADISPKFVAAGLMKSKNPIFLEAVDLTEEGEINIDKLQTVVSDYGKFMEDHIFAVQEAVFNKKEGMSSLKEGFGKLESWVNNYYDVN